MRTSERHSEEVIQRLSRGLAGHIANNATLMQAGILNQTAVRELFGKLMDVNPSVEVYLLGLDGRILAQAAPPGRLKRERVDMAPIGRLIDGEPLPISGDDPRSDTARKVFSVAPFRIDNRDAGYVYVVLHGEDHDSLAARLTQSTVLQYALVSMALVAMFGLVAGLIAFRWITRPLRQLTADVHRFEADGRVGLTNPAVQNGRATGPDEIVTLRQAFTQLTERVADQWRQLSTQDLQRREIVANLSHDLRTPLTSLHGYLETLRLKADSLPPAEQQRYLDIALGQSRKVGRLAEELFELARLEDSTITLQKENFSLADLLQDVFQKFELAAEARQQRLVADIASDLPSVSADLGMIERVLTNLIDNAIRHTPAGGEIAVALRHGVGKVDVEVSDTGPGIPEAQRQNLFIRPSFKNSVRQHAGGLGLIIVSRILRLHDSDIELVNRARPGTVFRFSLNAAR